MNIPTIPQKNSLSFQGKGISAPSIGFFFFIQAGGEFLQTEHGINLQQEH